MPINLASGSPDPRTVPLEDMGRLVDEILVRRGREALDYSETSGDSDVRGRIAQFLMERGIKAEYDDVLLTNGAKEAIFLVSELFSPNTVSSEEPTFQGFISTLSYRGIRAYPIPWDEQGPMLHIMERRLKALKMWADPVKYFYVIPVHNPTGWVMSLERKKYLMELAQDFDFKIVEDDIYGVFTYDSPPQSTLKSLDSEERVIYISSFSKILSPGLRVGFIAYEGEEIEKFRRLKREVNHQVSTLDQLIVGEMLKKGIIEQLLESSRSLYRRKRDLMMQSIEEFFPSSVGCTFSRGGFFTLCRGEGIISNALVTESAKRGVRVMPGELFFYSEESGRNSFRLSFSYSSEQEVKEGVKILGQLLRERR
ncbi:PLP-dependent aminotransferase family protein [Metallosphaera tengchongensis]|uniref:PLP-dependent aminotransferase family protein n=1 Tax=Metallosphaera tengchongensis TaxID=1532350 RepID=A0A6N0NV61_9CREN|nr:PLP-dependent aminotransferase family protein [Metallosphaera tengchongensis]QKR00696.1 PLP-dependent aminotransferase family protein [Metallosphaera tengchongensis]